MTNNGKRHNNPSPINQKRRQNSNQNKRSLGATLFSLIAIIAVAVYFFGDLGSMVSQTATDHTRPVTTTSTTTTAITGDAQIDNTIALIQQGGPYPYPNKDGTTFYNRESRLPAQSQGYYREYTVPTPGVSHRGARRIVTGGHPPTVYYLTIDHYDSFQKLEVP